MDDDEIIIIIEEEEEAAAALRDSFDAKCQQVTGQLRDELEALVTQMRAITADARKIRDAIEALA
jgi:Spy/CpxP family protein refolding chaperone